MGVLLLAAWGYSLLGTGFAFVPKDYQWILGIFSPLAREFYVWLSLEVSFKAAGPGSRGKESIVFPCKHYMEVRHASFLAIMLGGVATQATTYCVIGMDFALNIYHGLKIVYNLKYSKKSNKDEGNSLMGYSKYA